MLIRWVLFENLYFVHLKQFNVLNFCEYILTSFPKQISNAKKTSAVNKKRNKKKNDEL